MNASIRRIGRTARVGAILATSAAVVLLVPTAASAQQGPPPGELGDTTELVFEREVFSYPSFERRNPFRPLVGGEDGGPRFEELRLLGILQSASSELSVALFGIGGGGQGGQQGAGRTFRVREGQTLGNTRILDIQRSRVIVNVTEFGLTEQRVLELPRPNDGGI